MTYELFFINCTFYLGFPSVNLGINKRIFCKGYDLHIASLLEPEENSHTKTSRNDHLKSRRNSQCNSEEIVTLYSAIAEPIINLLITFYFLAL